MLWFLFEASVAIIGIYNIGKGTYNIYVDTQKIKKKYTKYKKYTKGYKLLQMGNKSTCTDSVLSSYEVEFIIIDN